MTKKKYIEDRLKCPNNGCGSEHIVRVVENRKDFSIKDDYVCRACGTEYEINYILCYSSTRIKVGGGV